MNNILLLFIFFISVYFPSGPCNAETSFPPLCINLVEKQYIIKTDLTYTTFLREELTINTEEGVRGARQLSQSFFRETQSLELVEATVIQPDGTEIKVEGENVFLTEAENGVDSPGFVNTLTKNVIFPMLESGSRIRIKWRLDQRKPGAMGINILHILPLTVPVEKTVISVRFPVDLSMTWGERGGFDIKDRRESSWRTITATYEDHPAASLENAMLPPCNITPVFAATTTLNWDSLAKMCNRIFMERIEVTPEIRRIADKIIKITALKKEGIGGKKALARAVYNWVRDNIHYVSIRTDYASGYMPNDMDTILRNRYGDCKDQVAVMIALLSALDIRAFPALVSWGEFYSTLPAPLINQFNHVIVYIPQFNIFANPSLPFSVFGELDNGLYGQFALIASEKGMVARIPKLEPEDNRYAFSSSIQLNNDGVIKGRCRIESAGPVSTAIRRLLSSYKSLDELAEEILAETVYGGSGIIAADNIYDVDHDLDLSAHWSSPYSFDLKGRIYFTIPVGVDFKKVKFLLQYIAGETRKYPLLMESMSLSWEYQVSLPSFYDYMDIPDDVEVSNQAGSYHAKYWLSDKSLYAKRNLVISKDIFNVKEYVKLRSLLYRAVMDFRSVVAIERKTLKTELE